MKDSPGCLNHNSKPSNREIQKRERERDLSDMGGMKMILTELTIRIDSTYLSHFKLCVKDF